jgi:long-chain acyl-CoA synthetase
MEEIAAAISAAREKANVPSSVDLSQYANLIEMFAYCATEFADRPVISCMSKTLTYRELDVLSAQFACYLQNHTNLRAGDRIALQMPNILQYPVALFGAIRAGMIVVNTNPLYSERELKHQLNDSGAKVLVVLANVAEAAAAVIPDTPVETVIVTEIADLHTGFKRPLINTVVKRVKKMVPNVSFKNSISYRKALSL